MATEYFATLERPRPLTAQVWRHSYPRTNPDVAGPRDSEDSVEQVPDDAVGEKPARQRQDEAVSVDFSQTSVHHTLNP